MREARAQLALLRFVPFIVSQLGSISSLCLIPTIHSFSSLRVQHNTHGVLENPNLSQAMAPSKQKRTHTVFRASSAHRSTSTSKPRFVGERVKRGELLIGALAEPRNALPRIPERRLDSIGKISDTSNKLQLYQSVRHCSKTRSPPCLTSCRLITSQFDTAPKLPTHHVAPRLRLITSQFDTAPKLVGSFHAWRRGLITSQFDTAPKHGNLVGLNLEV